MGLAQRLHQRWVMKPLNQFPTIVALAANDLPDAPSAERARARTRERRLRGPSWRASPPREAQSA